MIKRYLVRISFCFYFLSAVALAEMTVADETVANKTLPNKALESKESKNGNIQTSHFPVNKQITNTLARLSTLKSAPLTSAPLKNTMLKNTRIENNVSTPSLLEIHNYNLAEQYLVHIIRAIELKQNNLLQEAIATLTKAKSLEENIQFTQLIQPDFSQLYLLLATYYVEQGSFELAYIAHKDYFKKYTAYYKSLNKSIIDELSEKHKINQKNAQNELLLNQNKLKKLHLIEEQQLKKNQQRNFALIICAILLFTIFFIRQIKQKQKLIKQAKTDRVTGFLNRKSLFRIGAKMIHRFIYEDNELSLLILKFKPHSTLNHIKISELDKVISQMALLIAESTRSRDSLFRLANEEFVVLLPHSNIFKAKAVAERINEKVASLAFNQHLPSHLKEALGQSPAIHLSIGISALTPLDTNFESLLHKADLAMHQANEKGDNCVLTYESIANHFERRGR
jgi:diguanylate cyclase (GGDEF)-like protein